MLTEGGYVQLAGETGWWIPSGRVFYSPGDSRHAGARSWRPRSPRFFLPRRAVDPFGAVTRAGYDTLPAAAGVGDRPGRQRDVGGQRLPGAGARDGHRPERQPGDRGVRRARPGHRHRRHGQDDRDARRPADRLHRRPGRGDAGRAQFADPLAGAAALLGNATTRILYDARRLSADQRRGAALAARRVYTLARETHVSDLAAPPPTRARRRSTRCQYRFAYGDGFGAGNPAQGPGAPGRSPTAAPRCRRGGPGPAGRSSTTRAGRSATTSRSSPPRPASSSPPRPASATVTFYDPPGRAVATLHPDNTLAEDGLRPVAAGALGRQRHRARRRPARRRRTSAATSPGCSPAPAVHVLVRPAQRRPVRRDGRTAGRAAGRGAQDGSAPPPPPPPSHIATRSAGPAWRSRDNGPAARYPVRTAYDTEGTPLAVFDELGRRAAEYVLRQATPGGGTGYIAGTDMAGRPVYRISADGGARRTLPCATGQAIGAWDARSTRSGWSTTRHGARRAATWPPAPPPRSSRT